MLAIWRTRSVDSSCLGNRIECILPCVMSFETRLKWIALFAAGVTLSAAVFSRSNRNRAAHPTSVAQTQDSDAISFGAERTAQFAAIFDKDKGSTVESQQVEQRVRDALTSPSLSGVHLDQLECRARVCKFVSTFQSRNADEAAINSLYPVSALSGYTIIVATRNRLRSGFTQATAYMFSPGILPDAPRTGDR